MTFTFSNFDGTVNFGYAITHHLE